MPYDPLNSLQFSFNTPYTPISGAALEFRLGDYGQVCEIWQHPVGRIYFAISQKTPVGTDFAFLDTCYPATLVNLPACIEVRPFIAPSGSGVDFDLYKKYIHPVAPLAMELADCMADVPPTAPLPWYQIPSAVSPGVAVSFTEPRRPGSDVDGGWGQGIAIAARLGCGSSRPKRLEPLLGASWAGIDSLASSNRVAWDRLFAHSPTLQNAWHVLSGCDRARQCPYGEYASDDAELGALWQSPPALDLGVMLPYTYGTSVDHDAMVLPWGCPPPHDRSHHTLWGRKTYDEICIRDYLPAPGGNISFDIGQALAGVGNKDHVDFFFEALSYDARCSFQEPSGWRDANVFEGWSVVPFGVVRSQYTMNSKASVTRLSDLAEVDVTAVTVATDMDSWGWTLSLSVASPTALEQLDPSLKGPVTVSAMINGFEVVGQIDSWSHGRKFAGDSRSAGGRSLSATLSAPTAATLTFIEGVAKTAQQIATDVLLYTGWVLDWRLTDWLVPAGVFAATEQTPLQVIQTIAAAGDGFVQSHHATKTLIVAPRVPVAPWDMATAIADVSVPEEMMDAMDGAWEQRPSFNAVLVSGSVGGGISMRVVRNGTAGDKEAPMVTDPLLCATEVCRARATGILAHGGKWRKMSCSMPVFAAPDIPGVLLPGTVISVTGADPWKGICTSVSVTAAWGRALVVRQVVEVERYYGV